MTLATLFQRSALLFAAVKSGFFDRMKEGWNDIETLANGEETEGYRRLADALVALGVLEKQGQLYRSSLLPYLRSDSPQSLVPFFKMIFKGSELWWNLREFLKKRKPPQLDEQYNRLFIQSMEARAQSIYSEVLTQLKSFVSKETGRIIDVGGGSGIFLRRFLQKYTGWHGALLDLPPALQVAQQKIAEEQLNDRISLIEGNVLQLTTIEGAPYDIALLIAFTHIFSIEENKKILKTVYQSLSENGLVVIYDYVLNQDRTAPEPGVIFAVQMWLSTASGNTYTLSEYKEMLTESGFSDPKVISLSGPTSILVSHKLSKK